MIKLNWIFLTFSLFVIIFKGEFVATSINFIARYSPQNLVLICDVQHSDVNTYNIYLNCPFMVGNLCYTNCKSNCKSSSEDCLPMISNCSTENVKEGHIRLKWIIDVTFVSKPGEWQCSHRNVKSNSISLEKHDPKPNKTIVTKKAPIVKTTTVNDILTMPPEIEKEGPKNPDKNIPHYYSKNDFWQFITQPYIVLVLVCVFTVSLVLNIIFVIRCALFRLVIDNYLKAKKSPNSCLFRCFCVPVNQNLPTVNMKSLNQVNPPVYLGYHREEVYDDMSSGSQADRHLINNYSHYEIEQDSLLSRKVWSPDGSNIMNNRQSHICPGQGVGNYVIVAGPVCTNRNYMSLNTPSNNSIVSNSQHTYTTDMMGRSPSNEFQRQEYSVGSDHIIYSQPIKNRTKSFDPVHQEEVSYKHSSNCMPNSPPPPPERHGPEQVHHTGPTSEPSPMKNVDLIEHCTNTANSETTEGTAY